MRRRGIAMVEAILATAIVGGVAVAAMSLVGSVAVERRVSEELSTGQLLAGELAEEIAALPLHSLPDAGVIDVSLPARFLYDDVIDYDGHVKSPPRMRDGTPIPGADGWTRTAEVTEVAASDPEGPEVAGTGLYRIRVVASVQGREAGEIVFFRSVAADGVLR